MGSSRLLKVMIGVLIVLALLAILINSKLVNLQRAPSQITPTPSVRATATLSVDGSQWGVSTCYIGAVEEAVGSILPICKTLA